MPKQFSEQERRKIDARLLSVARDLLAHRSARKIVVEELTRAAGISKGSFYLFYPTKETLFYEVMRLEERTVQGPLIAALEASHSRPIKSSQSRGKQSHGSKVTAARVGWGGGAAM